MSFNLFASKESCQLSTYLRDPKKVSKITSQEIILRSKNIFVLLKYFNNDDRDHPPTKGLKTKNYAFTFSIYLQCAV